MQVGEAVQEGSEDYGYGGLGEGAGFELHIIISNCSSHNSQADVWQVKIVGAKGRRTKSKQLPPPRYSITIHSLCPLRKLSLYCVTN